MTRERHLVDLDVGVRRAPSLLRRFDEARASATRALDIYRSFGSTAFYEAVSLTLLGEAWIGLSRPEQARPVLDQALRAFDADRSTYRWRAAFALARALPAGAPDRDRARSLAREARDGFVAAGDASEAKVVDAWLAAPPATARSRAPATNDGR